MFKDFELVFVCKDGTTESYWYANKFEAEQHARFFDADPDNDTELYDHLEIRHWRGDYYVTIYNGRPWEQAS